MIVDYWRSKGHYVIEMMRAGMSVVNEETGEMSFSILGRCVLGDHVKSDFNYMSNMYQMLPIYNAIKKDVLNDCNNKESISWRHKINVNSDEVRSTSMFFRQTIESIMLNKYKSYTGTEVSFSSKIAAGTHLSEKYMPLVYKCNVSVHTTEICTRLRRDLNTNTYLKEHRDLWPSPEEKELEESMDDENMDGGEELDVAQMPVVWGADWDECKVGSFAIVHTEFSVENMVTSGICVYKIIEKHGENAQPVRGADRTFNGLEYLCTQDNTQLGCVNATWNNIEGKSQMSIVNDWNVIAYVHNLRNGKKLPIYVANNIERHVTAGELLYSRVLDE